MISPTTLPVYTAVGIHAGVNKDTHLADLAHLAHCPSHPASGNLGSLLLVGVPLVQ